MKEERLIGERIKARRLELGMSQKELADKLGFKSDTSITQIENGDRSLKLDKVKPMANALNVDFSYIMGFNEEENSQKEKEFDPFDGLSDEKKSIIISIISELSDLPSDKMAEVRRFIEFIGAK